MLHGLLVLFVLGLQKLVEHAHTVKVGWTEIGT